MIFYKFEETENILIWDIEKDIEYDNFSTKKGDIFRFYCQGIPKEKKPPSRYSPWLEPPPENVSRWKYSERGYLMFNYYFVNLDNMIPSPYIQVRKKTVPPKYWNMGLRMSTDEKYVLIRGNLVTSFSYMDLFLRSRIGYNIPSTIHACKYFVDRISVIADYDSDTEQLKEVLELLKNDPIYYCAILLPNYEGESPMSRAIERNSPKVVELFLKYLSLLSDYKLSKSFYPYFDRLFDMGITEFKEYLSGCYFTTGQMKLITKVYPGQIDKPMLEASNSSMLQGKFLK